ncbi:MAG: Holliday junction resolvase RuvX [Anaerolineales bacterium]|uniref:Holliday junction resolvase RuvX n=1 Tax=Promineifilum sp. TaxID=2664178 RepID=UPI001DE3824C|nr:Holliday junction resolvase RuvX [Anaerolineales bacterium]MCB8935646.1 Holliday junction resolvase RuvX [Promineifilum sp.]MCO5180750.1 Holliday junction resolvase RuvX [Promineifilum sp.]
MMTTIKDNPGRVMALDLGEKRIGIAISDPTRTIASPHSVLNRASRAADFAHYAQLINEQRITLLVIGLPITLGGQEGQRAAWVRDYADGLRDQIDIPITFWDESLSTVAATAALHAQGRRGRKVKERVDAVAAALILQSYLDAQPEESPYD